MADPKFAGEFSAPPAHAPREVSSPQIAPTAEQRDAARRNERALQPLDYSTQQAPVDVPKQVVPRPVQSVLPARPPVEERSHQPAASNSDSPSRGIPREIDDPGKIITGGFGFSGPAQYFPLTGDELKLAVQDMMDKLNARIMNDLRFSMAVTYPRARVVLSLTFKGYTEAEPHEIRSEFVHEKTPEDIARAGGAVASTFEIAETIQEFDDEGNPDNPPDRVRDTLGIEKPRKQSVDMAGERHIVDRQNLLNSF